MRQKDIAEILCVSRPNVSKCLKKHMARLTSSKTNYRVQWNMERLTYGYMKKKKSTIKIIKRSKNGKEEIIEKQK
jgi:predicted transcriptional regulator